MKEGPDIPRIASLIGDPARANILTALMDGRALTASELASLAGVTKQTASAHLAKLLDGGLLAAEAQGRHRYFRLTGRDVAELIEALMGVAETRTGKRTRTGPKDPALRKARICYDHLAGELSVRMFDRLLEKRWLRKTGEDLSVTATGAQGFREFGLDTDGLSKGRRPLCRACLDWSMRRHHLAGSLGRAMLETVLKRNWARRVPGTRIIHFSTQGESAFVNWLR